MASLAQVAQGKALTAEDLKRNQTMQFTGSYQSLASPVTAQRAELSNIADLSSRYGNINYDQNAIKGIFDRATNAEYDAKQREYQRTAGQYYDKLATSQDAYLQAMRKSQAGAVQNGANAGMQNANALSAMLGLSQMTSSDALQLAQQERALADQRAAALTANETNAMKYADTQKLAAAGIDVQAMANNAQQYAAELGHNAQLGAADLTALAQRYAADQGLAGQRYASDQSLLGTQYNADRNMEGNKYSADQNLLGSKYVADQNLQGTQYAADKNLEGAKVSAQATRAAAGAAAGAAKYAARLGYNSQITSTAIAKYGAPATAMLQQAGLLKTE